MSHRELTLAIIDSNFKHELSFPLGSFSSWNGSRGIVPWYTIVAAAKEVRVKLGTSFVPISLSATYRERETETGRKRRNFSAIEQTVHLQASSRTGSSKSVI